MHTRLTPLWPKFLHSTLHPQPKSQASANQPFLFQSSGEMISQEFLHSHLSNFTKPINMGAHFQQGRHPNFCPAHSCNNKLTWTSAVNVTQTMQCQQDSNVSISDLKQPVELSSIKNTAKWDIQPFNHYLQTLYFQWSNKRYFLHLTFDQKEWTILPVIKK